MKRSRIFSLLLLAGCAGLPPKPAVPIGQLDIPRNEVIEGVTGQPATVRGPLSGYDKATCFTPPAWETYRVYVDDLRAFAQACAAGFMQ